MTEDEGLTFSGYGHEMEKTENQFNLKCTNSGAARTNWLDSTGK